jgi:hypothetical protein
MSELPHAKALRLPVSTTDSIPMTGYGGLSTADTNTQLII